MRWVLDGYNLIRHDPELRDRERAGLEAGRTALLALVARVARAGTDEFTVVFDGARRGGGVPAGGRVQVIFSRPPETADDVLRRLAADLRAGAVVVTSDRAVQTTARRAGAVTVTAEAFLAAVEAPADTADEWSKEDDADAEGPPRRGGPARRPSREARAATRALERLRPR
jgi:predicted RNA-binding protein with PIN domain